MTNSTDIPTPRLHLGLLIHLANQFKDQLISHYFSATDITAAQFKVLISIYKGFNSPVEVSKNLLMDAGAMSRMLERMVKRELIVRNTNQEDKRQVILGLTDKGRAICDRFQNEALATILGTLTERLTPDEAQQLVALLIKMLPDEATRPHR
ncbi:MarR family transcriptional regulator, multiple antibiotic resistance protein MarR [Kosakonia oryzendophytica]|uniref:HTH-type transcriptional regulator MgrA n=1 Tax=Kosakonia oryzendophytica TaxID=1005665 RepID=A0A1C4CGT7_9ENTR|nr:MarR family transcriptional regulator [Kosakonia oryzendophytica]AMO49807.1 MarR family transcriptional regulator [Enterobacter sp. FY-07]TDT59318.1 MarR family multiple antibiotic resistance transcriptional regulator [Enterobacter sp. AG5470]WBT60267.1 MarR family transcriptional regulator [Kosakonia oryzendophytica]SCC18309.1 MarR family transcriptional regulator, multiple antibiotic resistance protein MarR [Kosakonia oryzendophytica]